jgi:hypothetical protein
MLTSCGEGRLRDTLIRRSIGWRLSPVSPSIVLLLVWTADAFAQTLYPTPAPQQLPPGDRPGTFFFTYSSQVGFTQEPAFPVIVSIETLLHRAAAKIRVKNALPFTITASLTPGTYAIDSEMVPEKSRLYWPAFGQNFILDPQGVVTYLPGSGPLVHQKIVWLLEPDPGETATVPDPRPLLKWKPLTGADHYKAVWLVNDPNGGERPQNGFNSGDITATEFRLPDDVTPGRRYDWSVVAFAADNQEVGYGPPARFLTPSGPPEVPFFGIVPAPDPPGLAGITIQEIVPDSPAAHAGLLPEDVLIRFNGHALEKVSTSDLADLIRQVPVGTVVAVDFVRKGVKGSVSVTMGGRP